MLELLSENFHPPDIESLVKLKVTLSLLRREILALALPISSTSVLIASIVSWYAGQRSLLLRSKIDTRGAKASRTMSGSLPGLYLLTCLGERPQILYMHPVGVSW